MLKLRVYTPRENTEASILLGLPGFLHEDEKGRIDSILETLCLRENIAGVRVNFPGIRYDEGNKSVVCEVNLNDYVGAIKEAINTIRANSWFNVQKIGVITSSVSAGILGHYLSTLNRAYNPFTCCLNISPLPGWPYFLTPNQRELIKQHAKGIQLTTQADKSKEISRFIPYEYLTQVLDFDALKALNGKDISEMKVMTLIGSKDNIVERNAMLKFHHLLGGNAFGLKEYDSEHDVPLALFQEDAYNFFAEHLRL